MSKYLDRILRRVLIKERVFAFEYSWWANANFTWYRWGLDSLSDLEDDSDAEDESEEEEEEAEELREKLLADAEEAQEEPIAQKQDKDVDDLADELKKKTIIWMVCSPRSPTVCHGREDDPE